MLKKILLALILVVATTVTHADPIGISEGGGTPDPGVQYGITDPEEDEVVEEEDNGMKIAASKAYVDTMVETRQDKIPAAGQPNVGAGETVMTYTATGNGQIGERGLYSDISSYNASTDGDKLITASALNATFTNLPTTPTTKLECANESDGCTLWTIVDQTAYHKPRKNLFDETNMTGTSGTRTNSYMSQFNVNSANLPRIELERGTTYTLSFDIETNVFPYGISVGCGNGSYTRDIKQIGESFTDNGRVSITFTPTDEQLSYGNIFAFRAPRYSQPKDFTYSISNIQLELGDTATPYEPYY